MVLCRVWLVTMLQHARLLSHLLMLYLPAFLQDAVEDVNQAVLVVLEPEIDDVLVKALFLECWAIPR